MTPRRGAPLPILAPLVLALAGCAGQGNAPVAVNAPARPAATRLPPPLHIVDLLGADPGRVEASLGAPALRRKDGEAEVWLYAGNGDCRVDLVFFRDANALKLADARTRAPAETQCLKQIAALPGL